MSDTIKSQSRLCFFIMPFRPELNFFYLYIRDHLKRAFNIDCERADHRILTKPLIDKIRDSIKASDILIADITGRNPNVFYELGFADALDKTVILITQDDVNEAPTDIRHREFIKYSLDNDSAFIANIDNAIRNIFVNEHKALYKMAVALHTEFCNKFGLRSKPRTIEEFQLIIMQSEFDISTANLEDDFTSASMLLPRIINHADDIAIMEKILAFLKEKYSK